MLSITLEQAESLVKNRRDLSWDGWTIVQFLPNAGGMFNKNGAFNRATSRWGIVKRFMISDNGRYTVPRSFGNDL